MFEHLFAEMNSTLDQIAQQYPLAQGPQKELLVEKWNVMKQISDRVMEEWLALEEKMGQIRTLCGVSEVQAAFQIPELYGGPFSKGQGYFQLQMYDAAAEQFREASERYAQNPMPLLFLAVCFVRLKATDRAEACFTRILTYSSNNKLKSICCNALGCIAGMEDRQEQAKEMFLSAYKLDPTLPEPLANLEVCMANQGNYQFESQLHTLI